jgi:PAS domain S-box-containing protein
MSDSRRISFHQTEEFYQHLFDSAPDVMLMIDRSGEIQVANSRCQDLLGYAYGDMQGTSVSELLAESGFAALEVMLTGVHDGTHMPEIELETKTREGKTLPMMLDVREIETEGPVHFLVRMRDLSEIKVLEQQYRDLFESIGDAVFIGDPESGQIFRANYQACQLTGYSQGELMGMGYDEVHSESWKQIREEIVNSGEKELSGREMSIRTGGGEVVPSEVHLRLVSRGDDEIYIETVIDITDRKALENRMKDLRAEWDSFIRHELRNPLTPIMAFSQILMEDFPEVRRIPKVLQYLEAIWQGGKRLERLLDLTWEVQAYEQGQVVLDPVVSDFYPTVRSAISDAASGVGEETFNERVKLNLPDSTESAVLEVFHDPQKIQRSLTNLIKNALEHDPGEVNVNVDTCDSNVRVSVQNFGEPIPPDRIDTIFEKFNTTKRDKKGTGLGTTIAKLFVEAHGGKLKVRSSVEEGTVFTISIPIQDNSPEPND